jgi:hypothetical protein
MTTYFSWANRLPRKIPRRSRVGRVRTLIAGVQIIVGICWRRAIGVHDAKAFQLGVQEDEVRIVIHRLGRHLLHLVCRVFRGCREAHSGRNLAILLIGRLRRHGSAANSAGTCGPGREADDAAAGGGQCPASDDRWARGINGAPCHGESLG